MCIRDSHRFAKTPAIPVPTETSPTRKLGKPFKNPKNEASPRPYATPVKTLAMIAIAKYFLLSLWKLAKAIRAKEKIPKLDTMSDLYR